MLRNFLEAEKLIRQAQNILLATHEQADGDAIGSLLALKLGLGKFGKKVEALMPSSTVPQFNFLPGFIDLKTDAAKHNHDLIIGLDYGSPERLGIEQSALENKKFITIDHHLVGRHLGLKIVEKNCSSTSELIYQLLLFLGVPISFEIATCILAGIFSDTAGFRHANTSARTLKIAGELLTRGAPLQKIAKAENSFYFTPAGLKSWVTAFKNLEVDQQAGMISTLITQKDCPSINGDWKGSAIVSLLSMVPEIKFALLCLEKQPGKIDCSLRSQKDRGFNVAAIAQRFGGGGHKLAAGFQTTDSPQEIVTKIKNLALDNFSA